MKITFVINVFPAISETFILNQITGLLDKGIDLRIISARRPASSLSHPEVSEYKLLDRTTYACLPDNIILSLLGAIPILIRLVMRFPKKILSLFKLFFSKDVSCLYYLDILKDDNNDVIHSHFGPFGDKIAKLKKAEFLSSKTVTTFYGYDLTKYLQKYPNAYKTLLETSDLLLPICQYFKDILIKRGAEAGKIKIHHLGVNISKFEPVSVNRNKSGDPLTILTIGRIASKKGHLYSIEAIKGLIENNYNVKYVIVGDGPDAGKIRSLVHKYSLDQNVHFAGELIQTDVLKYLAQADIFLHPSVTDESGDKEGTPTAIIEAQACGIPAVATFHSGIPEIIANNQSGFLVQEKDVNGLIDALKQLCSAADLRKTMGTCGKEKMKKEFNIDTLVDQLILYYRDLLR